MTLYCWRKKNKKTLLCFIRIYENNTFSSSIANVSASLFAFGSVESIHILQAFCVFISYRVSAASLCFPILISFVFVVHICFASQFYFFVILVVGQSHILMAFPRTRDTHTECSYVLGVCNRNGGNMLAVFLYCAHCI